MTTLYCIPDRRRVAGVAAFAVTYALMPHAPETVARLVGTPFLFVFTVLWPGRALARMTRSTPRDAADAVAAWGVHGLALLLLLAFAWGLTPLHVGGMSILVGVVVSAVGLFAPRADTTRIRPRGTRPRGERTTAAAIGLIALVASLIGFSGPPTAPQKDTHDYAAWAGEVAETGEAFPVTSFYADPGANGGDIRKGLLHSIYGFYLSRENTDAYHVLGAMAVLLFALTGLSVYRASWFLLENRRAAALATMIFVLTFDGGPRSDWIRSWFYPGRFAMAPAILFVAAALDAMRACSRRSLIACTVLAFTAVAIHIQYAVILGFAVLVILVGKPVCGVAPWPAHVRRALRVGAFALAGIGPYAVWRALTGYQSNPLHTQVQWAVYVGDTTFIMDPTRLAGTWGLMGLASIAGALALWPRRGDRTAPGVVYTCFAIAGVLAIQFNPFILPAIYRYASYLVYRLDRVVPWFLVPAAVIVLPRAWDAGRFRKTARSVCLGISVLAAIPAVTGLASGTFSRSSIAEERAHGFSAWTGALEEMQRRLPTGAVIVSDPVTSYSITASTSLRVLCTLDQHAPPNDRSVVERVLAARDVISPFTPTARKTGLLNHWRARYIAVNTKPPRMVLDYWNLTEATARAAVAAFEAHPGLFQRVFAKDGIIVYRWTGRAGTGAVPPLPVVDAAPDSADRVGARFDGVELVAAQAIAKPGKDGGRPNAVDVRLYWRSDAPPPGNYVASVRLDAKSVDLPSHGAPFPKIARKLAEAFRRTRYRSRSDFMSGAGIFGPELWPEGTLAADTFRVGVPGDLAPGAYEVRVSLARRAHVANHRLRDFFYDDDSYYGVEIGTIEIPHPPLRPSRSGR